MMNWISPIELDGSLVNLRPLKLSDKDLLLAAAADGELSKFWYTGVPDKSSIDEYISQALSKQQQGIELTFVVRLNSNDKVVGCSRYCSVDRSNRRLEIGYTWFAKSVQRSGVNTETKFLMLCYAFEQLKTIAIEFKTHWLNHQSRNAILRLGAKQDGVLRNHRIMPDGSYRDTVVFSIIESEWLAIKQHLLFKISAY